MSKVDQVFRNLKTNNQKALITYITCGDINLSFTEKMVYLLEKAGVDIIELGIPFSDPLADGPIIQASHQRALKQNVDLTKAFALVKRIRKKSQIPIVFMASINLIYKFSFNKFIDEAEKNGIDGVIIPDLPIEEEFPIFPEEISHIRLVAPNTPIDKMKKITNETTGFVYLVSITGVTGKRQVLSDTIQEPIDKLRKVTSLPIALGFGISTPAQAKEAAHLVEGVIVGSAIVKIIEQYGVDCVPHVAEYVRMMKNAIK